MDRAAEVRRALLASPSFMEHTLRWDHRHVTLLLGEWKRKSCSSFERQSTQQQYLYYLNNLHSSRGAPFCLCTPTEAGNSKCCCRHLSGDELKPIHEVSAQSLPENVINVQQTHFYTQILQYAEIPVSITSTNKRLCCYTQRQGSSLWDRAVFSFSCWHQVS